ncbi:class I adenylate-forming enzyme family protein [Pseudooceanicola onchidii]|uniref:class I adenylate-forming enzyme family protein n=1 Tax=Pseudooceanicola onchidii TaxID=2562279 RepID=UPI0010A99F9C|nr:AMP-binding protein [Pseudooceanicola onchidii]
MQNDRVLNMAEIVDGFARIRPDRIGARDLDRDLTYAQWSGRANQLAQGLMSLGLAKGDRVAVLAWNCLEWVEIYVAAAKCGVIVVPVNFRLTAEEASYILEDSGATAIIAQEGLHPVIDTLRPTLDLSPDRFVHFGGPAPDGWTGYEALIAAAPDRAPDVAMTPEDPWTLMYTSGTTGRPKGVIRNHRGMAMIALVTEVELSIRSSDNALLVMPMCHANSLNFFCSFAYAGAEITVHSRRSFDAAEVLSVMGRHQCSFTSLVPTQYIMMLSLPEDQRRVDGLDCMTKLMISSAPARAETKRDIMKMFPNSGLFELYGSSEAGWVTMLHPDEQFSHLGSVGRECVGSGPIRLLDDTGQEVPDGEPGELFSLTPYTFSGYWNLPEKTTEAFNDGWCSVGDMGIRDEHGFIKLVDRKKNMIISGGENIYPSEVEAVLGRHEAVQDVAVIGVPHELWGEAVHGVVVLHAGATITGDDLIAWSRDKIAGYKRPRSITIITEAEMPRTATGKVLHRVLRDTFAQTAGA